MLYFQSVIIAFSFVSGEETESIFCFVTRFESNQISQTNHTPSIELVKVSETVLRAAHAGGLHDFVIFDVRTAITPNVKKVTAGDVIILQSSVATDQSGHWMAEPSGIIEIENIGTSSQGFGVALRSGQARISFLLNENRRVTLDFVSKIKPICLDLQMFKRLNGPLCQFSLSLSLFNIHLSKIVFICISNC